MRIGSIARGKPEKIFIAIGTNELKLHLSKELFAASFERMIDSVRFYAPATTIYLQSILPKKDSPSDISIPERNSEIARVAHEKGAIYVNVYNALGKEGQLDPSMTFDGTHLNEKGYAAWCDVLKAHIR